MFDRFYRGGDDASRPAGGAGLGLAIARAIVEAHGGRIWVANPGEPGARWPSRCLYILRHDPDSPLVGIVMGSDSDLKVMRQAADALQEFGVTGEVRALSAHRTPDETIAWARGAVDRGLRVLIAGAGAAAHLPGVVAAVTPLPVIGVPIDATSLGGLDALLSIAQMPSGVPVATVAVGGARNAGLLAARILGAGDDAMREQVVAFQARLADSVRERDARVQAELAAT